MAFSPNIKEYAIVYRHVLLNRKPADNSRRGCIDDGQTYIDTKGAILRPAADLGIAMAVESVVEARNLLFNPSEVLNRVRTGIKRLGETDGKKFPKFYFHTSQEHPLWHAPLFNEADAVQKVAIDCAHVVKAANSDNQTQYRVNSESVITITNEAIKNALKDDPSVECVELDREHKILATLINQSRRTAITPRDAKTGVQVLVHDIQRDHDFLRRLTPQLNIPLDAQEVIEASDQQARVTALKIAGSKSVYEINADGFLPRVRYKGPGSIVFNR